MITDVNYIDEPETQIGVDYDDGAYAEMSWPSGGGAGREVETWAAQNTIGLYVEHSRLDDEGIRTIRYHDNQKHADTLVLAAQANPFSGAVLTPAKTALENARRANRGLGKLKITDRDDAMSDYIDSVYDALDSANDALELLSLRADILGWTPANATWPSWAAPA